MMLARSMCCRNIQLLVWSLVILKVSPESFFFFGNRIFLPENHINEENIPESIGSFPHQI